MTSLALVLLLADQLGPGEVLELAEGPALHWTLVSPGSQMPPHRVLPPGKRPQTGRGGHAHSSSRSVTIRGKSLSCQLTIIQLHSYTTIQTLLTSSVARCPDSNGAKLWLFMVNFSNESHENRFHIFFLHPKKVKIRSPIYKGWGLIERRAFF